MSFCRIHLAGTIAFGGRFGQTREETKNGHDRQLELVGHFPHPYRERLLRRPVCCVNEVNEKAPATTGAFSTVRHQARVGCYPDQGGKPRKPEIPPII
jgi:hypothetical protein